MQLLNRRRWSGRLLFLLSTMVVACSAKPSVDRLAKELKTVASWTATAHMVGDEWLKDAVPKVYAKQTLQAVQDELSKEAKAVVAVAPASDRTTVQKQLQSIEQSLDQMAKDVEQDDRATLAQDLKRLSTQEQALAQWIKARGGQP